MDNLRAILDKLTDKELDYVFERSKVLSDADGYRAAGISKANFYKLWDAERRAELNDMAQALKRDRIIAAEMILIESAELAAQFLVDTIGNKKAPYTVRQRSADSVLDRTAGKATQPIEHKGAHGGPIDVEVTWQAPIIENDYYDDED